MPAPVVLFTYRRPLHTLRTLEHLRNNVGSDKSVLYVFSDGVKENGGPNEAKDIAQVRKVIRSQQWCKEVHIIESVQNMGLANSIINGVTQIVDQFDKAIVLEDDLISSKYFLQYMNEGLDRYKDEERVMQISGHNFPVGNIATGTSFFLRHATTLGWAVWKRSWKYFDKDASGYTELKNNPDLANRFDLDGAYGFTRLMLLQMETNKVDSWGIRWLWSVFKNNGLTLFPDKTLIKHIESMEGATHVSGHYAFAEPDFDVNYKIEHFPDVIVPDEQQLDKIKSYLKEAMNKNNGKQPPSQSNIFKTIIHKILNTIK